MKPTIGRIVHYTNLGDRDGKYPPEVQAALITRVHSDEAVALHVFYPTGQSDIPTVLRAGEGVAAGAEDARGKWQWPARESA
jgi:hypothetical protein